MKQFTITENDSNQRLDKFLKKLFPSATRGLIYKFNRKGKIKVNGKKEDNEYKLSFSDEVKIFLTDEDFKVLSEKETRKEIGNNKLDKKDIVYEDSDILIINKSAGINVHPGDYKTKELSLISLVHDYLGDKLNSLTFKPSLVHRLDRDTSGCIIIAKRKDILQKLVADLKNHKIKKTYLAFVIGKLEKKSGTISENLERIKGAKKEDKVQISSEGKKAITHYKVINEITTNNQKEKEIISVLEINIDTGRMHQIRVHLANIGHPVIGDDKYGDKKKNFLFSRNYGIDRQALHSWKIGFFHPGKSREVSYEARIKDDMKAIYNPNF